MTPTPQEAMAEARADFERIADWPVEHNKVPGLDRPTEFALASHYWKAIGEIKRLARAALAKLDAAQRAVGATTSESGEPKYKADRTAEDRAFNPGSAWKSTFQGGPDSAAMAAQPEPVAYLRETTFFTGPDGQPVTFREALVPEKRDALWGPETKETPLYAHPAAQAAKPSNDFRAGPVAPDWRAILKRARLGVMAGSCSLSDMATQEAIAYPLLDHLAEQFENAEAVAAQPAPQEPADALDARRWRWLMEDGEIAATQNTPRHRIVLQRMLDDGALLPGGSGVSDPEETVDAALAAAPTSLDARTRQG
jgi:hypothetical protein